MSLITESGLSWITDSLNESSIHSFILVDNREFLRGTDDEYVHEDIHEADQ